MTDSPANEHFSSSQPPPLPPPGQYAPPPPMAGGQPGGGPQPVLPVMPYSGGYPPYWGPPPTPPENPRAKTLIFWSRILGWGGIAIFLFGSIVGSVVMSAPAHDTTVLIVSAGGGFGIAAVGAVIGQVGRAMQGRVI